MQVHLDHFFDWVFWVNFLGDQILTGVLCHFLGGPNFNDNVFALFLRDQLLPPLTGFLVLGELICHPNSKP